MGTSTQKAAWGAETLQKEQKRKRIEIIY